MFGSLGCTVDEVALGERKEREEGLGLETSLKEAR